MNPSDHGLPIDGGAGDLAVGFTPIDTSHVEFSRLINMLLATADEGIAVALDSLRDQVQKHFAEEEAWMKESSFPAGGCHADEHAAVLASVSEVCAQVAKGDFGAARDLGRALEEWLPGHIDHLDSALAQWLCQKRFGGKPLVFRPPALASRPSVHEPFPLHGMEQCLATPQQA